MAASQSTYLSRSPQGIVSRLRQIPHAAWRTYVKWYNRRAAHYYLSSLDDRMLQDIGISRGQIESAVRSGRSIREI